MKIKLNLTITGSMFLFFIIILLDALSLLHASLAHSFPLSPRFLCIFSVEWICLEVKKRERKRERERDSEKSVETGIV